MDLGTRFQLARQWVRGHGLFTWLAVVIGAYLLTRMLMIGSLPVFFDESIFIRWAQRVIADGEWLVSVTDGKPPLHVWSMLPFVAVFENPLVAGRLASVAAGTGSAAMMLLIGRRIGGIRLGAVAGLLYVLCPFTLWYDRVAVAEALLLFLFLLTVFIAMKAASSRRIGYVFLLGTSFGLALLTKGTAMILAVVVPFAYLTRPERLSVREGDRPLLKWLATVIGSLFLGYGIYSLLRLSPLFPLIGKRTDVATRSVFEVIRNPFTLFFSNSSDILVTLFVFMTPVILLVGIFGVGWMVRKKNKCGYFVLIWVVAVWLIESLVAEHWMFHTILPRFFLVIVPPLLLGAGYCMVEGYDWLNANKKTGKAGRAILTIVLVAALIFLPAYTVIEVIVAPSDAFLPTPVRFQYLTDWPSGWGIREISSLLRGESEKGPVTAGANLDGIGLPTDGLIMYLHENENITVEPFSMAAREFPESLARSADEEPAYVVYNMFSPADLPPSDWPLTMVHAYPKDGNPDMYMLLYRVIPTKNG
jgi:4-amino-4-deoxy-L-arabinose transferase-like glycosyltransferase